MHCGPEHSFAWPVSREPSADSGPAVGAIAKVEKRPLAHTDLPFAASSTSPVYPTRDRSGEPCRYAVARELQDIATSPHWRAVKTLRAAWRLGLKPRWASFRRWVRQGVYRVAREPLFDVRSKPTNPSSADCVLVRKLPGTHPTEERAAVMADNGDHVPRGQDLIQSTDSIILNSVRTGVAGPVWRRGRVARDRGCNRQRELRMLVVAARRRPRWGPIGGVRRGLKSAGCG
jgi:hypothetical protein